MVLPAHSGKTVRTVIIGKVRIGEKADSVFRRLFRVRGLLVPDGGRAAWTGPELSGLRF